MYGNYPRFGYDKAREDEEDKERRDSVRWLKSLGYETDNGEDFYDKNGRYAYINERGRVVFE